MEENQSNIKIQHKENTFGQMIVRFFTAAIVLGITAFFTPGFTINSIWALGLAAIILTVLDYMIVKFTGLDASPFGKGFVGFVLATVILYVTQFFVAGYSISWIAAIIGALIYGVIAYMMPGKQTM